MKLIIATIKPFKLDEVREVLTAAGVRGMMVSEIKGVVSRKWWKFSSGGLRAV